MSNKEKFNKLINNGEGIKLQRSSNNNIVSRNNIEDIRNSGLSIWYSSNYNIIEENNFIQNGNQFYFDNSYPTLWFNNYWDDWDKKLPRPIYGEIRLKHLNDMVIPWIQFDWKPASEPYDISC